MHNCVCCLRLDRTCTSATGVCASSHATAAACFQSSSPNVVPQPSYRPLTPSTPSTVPSDEVTSPTVPRREVTSPENEKPASTTARSEREATTRTVHHHHRARHIGM